MSLLVIMGSGETAPPLVPTHRRVFARVGDGPAVLLDTPFGFQENADELTDRARAYFADSVGREVSAVRWRRADAPSSQREAALASLRDAMWAFAGPGSPTYALAQWRGTPVPRALSDLVRRGGALVLGSAAAVVAGTHAVPVYEIYKAGNDPAWHDGLDLLGDLAGIPAAVIPHFDNREGGTHDTRYCYLGERRLRLLESALPEGTGVLGVDEHTALLLELDTGRAWVEGRGAATVRTSSASTALPAGTEVGVDELRSWLRGDDPPANGPAPAAGNTRTTSPDDAAPPAAPASPAAPTAGDDHADARDGPAGSLEEEAARQRRRFDAGLAARDVEACVAAILDLEAAIVAWRTDTLESDDADRARDELRGMVTRLGAVAHAGIRDPHDLVAPLIDAVLAARADARAAGDYATADRLRDALLAADVEVRDTAEGVAWILGARWGGQGL